MVPKIAKNGRSFKGAWQYYAHDKNAETAERVGFIKTVNLSTDNPKHAYQIMAHTFALQDTLKTQSGVDKRGRKLQNPVLSLSLSWAPDETPSDEEMYQAGLSVLKELGAENHQAFIVQHTDEPHPHIHIIINRVHPETGRALKTSYSRLTLSKWAERYEREQGKIRCEQRVENNKQRSAEMEKPKAERTRIKHKNPVIQRAWDRSDTGKSFQSALREDGYVLARGDKKARDGHFTYVVVDPDGKAINPTRQIQGDAGRNLKVAKLRSKFSDLDGKTLPSVDAAKQQQRAGQVFDRDHYHRERDEQLIDAAISHDQAQRLEQLLSARNALDLTHLDEQRAFDQWSANTRDQVLDQNKSIYQKEATLQALNKARQELKTRQGVFSRMTQQREKSQQTVDGLEKNLASIEQRENDAIQQRERDIALKNTALQERQRQEKQQIEYQLKHANDNTLTPAFDREAARKLKKEHEQDKTVRTRERQRER